MRVVALLVLCATLSSSSSATSLHEDDSSHIHRLARRSGAETAGAVVGVIVFFLFVGFCWIMCQHPQWNPCGECGCCSACAAGPRQHPYAAFVRMGPRHWLWAASRGRWGAKGAPPPDLEMQALGDDFARLHAQAQQRQPSYEKRQMRIPSPSPSHSHSHSHTHSQSRDSNATPEPPRASRDQHRARGGHGRHRSHGGSLHVPEPTHSHSRTRSEAVDRRTLGQGQSHERSTSDPTNRAFAEVFGESAVRPPPTAAPPARGRNDAIDRWRKAVAGE